MSPVSVPVSGLQNGTVLEPRAGDEVGNRPTPACLAVCMPRHRSPHAPPPACPAPGFACSPASTAEAESWMTSPLGSPRPCRSLAARTQREAQGSPACDKVARRHQCRQLRKKAVSHDNFRTRKQPATMPTTSKKGSKPRRRELRDQKAAGIAAVNFETRQ